MIFKSEGGERNPKSFSCLDQGGPIKEKRGKMRIAKVRKQRNAQSALADIDMSEELEYSCLKMKKRQSQHGLFRSLYFTFELRLCHVTIVCIRYVFCFCA